MKNIFLITLVFFCMFSLGKCSKHCKKKQNTSETSSNLNEVWMRYDDTHCANPWNFNWLVKPTTDQIVSAVRSNLEGRSIHIIDMKTKTYKDAVTCDACTCPTGFHYFVKVSKEDAAKLKELKFVEVNEPK